MAKAFLEAFPTLALKEDTKALLQKCEVAAVKYNHDKTAIRVYMVSERLIGKGQIYQLQQDMEKQLFPNGELQIQIVESFRLSDQYTVKYLVDAYRDSILTEARD